MGEYDDGILDVLMDEVQGLISFETRSFDVEDVLCWVVSAQVAAQLTANNFEIIQKFQVFPQNFHFFRLQRHKNLKST